MDPQALFGITVVMSFVSSAVAAMLFVWPHIRTMNRNDALVRLIAPHMFRFIGLSFLVPGVVSSRLPAAFAVPAAFGDLIAAVLAILATIGLSRRAGWSVASSWLFN